MNRQNSRKDKNSTLVCEGTIRYKLGEEWSSHRARRWWGFRRRHGLDKACLGDTVVIEYAGNVCDFDWQAISEHPGGQHEPAQSLAEFKQLYINLIRNLRASGLQPLLLSLPGLCAHRFINHVSENRDRVNILRWLGGEASFINERYEQYAKALQEVAEADAVPVIDISELFRQQGRPDDYYDADGIHLNEAGNALVNKKILNFNF